MKFNHVMLLTKDLGAMTTFLKQVAELEEGFRPPFPFRGAWLYSNGKPMLHLAEITGNSAQQDYLGPMGPGGGTGVVDHLAFEGADYKALINRLTKFGIVYAERTVPLTKEHQVFIVGPDSIKLEMVFNENKDDLTE